jgi:hypothetical protein
METKMKYSSVIKDKVSLKIEKYIIKNKFDNYVDGLVAFLNEDEVIKNMDYLSLNTVKLFLNDSFKEKLLLHASKAGFIKNKFKTSKKLILEI